MEEDRASGVVLRRCLTKMLELPSRGECLVLGHEASGDLALSPSDKVPASVGGATVRDRAPSEQGFCVHDGTDCEAETSCGEHSLMVRDPGVQASEGSSVTEDGRGHMFRLTVGAGLILGDGCWRETGSSWASVDRGSVADGTGRHGPVPSCGKTREELTLTGDPGSPRGQSSWGQLRHGVSAGGSKADCWVKAITQEMLGCLGVWDGPGARMEWGNQSNLPAENTSEPAKLDPPCSSENQAGVESVTVRMIGSVSLRAPMQVMDIEVMAVVDTGAEVTVLGQHLLAQLSETQRPKIHRATRTFEVAKKDDTLNSPGVATLDLNIGGHTYPWLLYIAETGEDLLLGTDFLDEHDITVQIRRGLLQHADWVLQCEVERRPNPVSRVLLHETWTVPSYPEASLAVPWEPSGCPGQATCVLEPAPSLPGGLLVARALVDCSQPVIPIRCINYSPQAISLSKGCVLGDVVLAESVLGQMPVLLGEGTPDREVPALGDLQHLAQIWQAMDESSL